MLDACRECICHLKILTSVVITEIVPFRREVLRLIGAASVVGLAGCSSGQTTSGTVATKTVTIGVPTDDETVFDVVAAVLTYEPEERLVTGEYPDILSGIFQSHSMAVTEQVHERVSSQYSYVHYNTNIVPDDGSEPANGRVSRSIFNTLSVGGTATVDPYMKSVDEDHSVGFLRVDSTSPLEQPPNETTVNTYSWEARVDDV
ncbi:hypothetical protein [Halomarina oriensis]|uniref:Uncharacterized protein n=1 Tax=Halomarina oriensis TaxID=671145 RepID=A0A6B0GDS1_9EURY|nr:hypothetical protein [Halomarina oriensis]MWG33076.1 hypothetical protein [Halomarina oriensis]